MTSLNSSIAMTTFVVCISLPAVAADHEVKMLNKGASGEPMVFEPEFLKVAPGDTVTFVPTDMSHNSVAVKGMLPEGAQEWASPMNQKYTVTLTKEGVYGYKCLPHYGMGMIGVIQVGSDVSNLGAARQVKHPGKARQKMEKLLGQIAN